MSEDEARYRSRIQHQQRRKLEPSRLKPRSKSTDATRKARHNHLQPTYIDDDDDRGRVVSPIPCMLLSWRV